MHFASSKIWSDKPQLRDRELALPQLRERIRTSDSSLRHEAETNAQSFADTDSSSRIGARPTVYSPPL